MDILVVGRGWTGVKVHQNLLMRQVRSTLVSHDQVFDHLAKQDWDWVINCAGVTGVPNVDACESDPGRTLAGNAVFPIRLYDACSRRFIRLAHWSSGCIYTGDILDVNAEPNFFGSIYSISKGISDSYLRDRAMVFRIRMPFTCLDEPKNYLTKIRKYAHSARLYDSGPNSLTDHDEAVRVACDLILQGRPSGAYNLVNPGSITMRQLAKIMRLEPKWFTEEEFAQATVAARSTCVIPACDLMSPLDQALARALAS